ncbi:hypothetical protein ACP3T3_16650 [Chryseobacterium sp. CBSDS_008]|uniref:hypothetical protein n=1 Tax=Chryseobacterium sp. CBSDS_008 TaxID=3415265 RepID=UPI003CEBE045
MKQTEDKIREKAIKIITDLTEGAYGKDNIININFQKDDELLIPKGKIIDSWTVSVKSLFDNRDFLILSDETGEPIYYQNFNYITTEIIKNNDGIYQYKK